MTTATVPRIPSGARGVDRLAMRIGTALVLWAARHADRRTLTTEQRRHRLELERLELHRSTTAAEALPRR